MKIVAIQLDRLRLPLDPPFAAAWDPVPRTHFDATVVRVRTDEGIVGYGSGDTMDGFEEFESLFLGRDPMAIVNHVKTLETISFHARRYWPVEAALWDIVGQVCGVPVATLFGGSTDRLPTYASFGELRPPAERAAAALDAVAAGFRAMKLRVAAHQLAAGVATVAAVRDAVGPDITIMVDLNQSWRMSGDIAPALDLASVRRFAAALAELDVFWLEEPLPLHDLSGIRTLREQAGVRVAGGEMVRTFPELLAFIEQDTLDVYQPDVVLAAGLLRARTLAELAHARHRWFTPHTWSNGLGLLANLQVAAGVGGGPFLEFPYDPPTWSPQRRDFFLAEPVLTEPDGCLVVPERSGLGALIDEQAVRRWAR